MIARLTRLLLLVQFLVAAGLLVVFIKLLPINSLALAALASIATVLLVRMAITANNFWLASRFRSKLPEDYAISIWETCRLFLGEYRATMTTSSWCMPFCAFSKHVARGAHDLPVLLVHGYGCNSGYWRPLSKKLLKAGITHYAINMEPIICGIDEYAVQIHRAVERVCEETGSRKIVIVAHSMGGLATRAYLRDHGSERVARVITLGTPHHGTALAHFGVGLNTQQMRWTASEEEGISSEWLRQLAAREDPAIYRLFVSIYSHHDNIISPQTSSHLEGAHNIEFHAIGHVALGFNPTVQEQVIREIRHASQEARSGPTNRGPSPVIASPTS